MAAIVRVKRRINDDPADSLVFSSKRPRISGTSDDPGNSDTEEIKNLFKFAGTIESEDDCVSRAVREAIKKEKLEREYKLHAVHPGSLISRSRARFKAGQQHGRYKVIAKRRAVQLEDLDQEDKENDPENKCSKEEKLPFKKADIKENECSLEGQTQKVYLLWDVEHETKMQKVQNPIGRPKATSASTITCNDVPLEREAVKNPEYEDQYVYDLYYMNRQDVDLRVLDNVLNIEALGENETFDQYREPEELEVHDDEDDSNDEDNWRNDYPDEDPKFFENSNADYTLDEPSYIENFGLEEDEELGTIIDRGLHLGGGAFGRQLSSDEEEQEPVYDFSQPLDTGIWGQDSTASNIWGSTNLGNSDAVADDWVSKSLDTDFDVSGGIWGSSVMNPWMSSTSATEESVSRLWAPTTSYEQYKAHKLQELGDDKDDKTDLT